MRISALLQLAAAAKALSRAERVTVLGSAALVAVRPSLADDVPALALTRDADLLLDPCDDGLAAMVHEAMGSGSLYDGRFGCYVDLMRAELLATLPVGWENRLLAMDLPGCQALAPVDVAAVKCWVGRDKDLQVVQALLQLGVVEPHALRETIGALPVSEREVKLAMQRLTVLLR